MKCPLITIEKECTGISPLDFFSLGHLVMGHLGYIFISMLFSTLNIWLMLSVVLSVAIGWEVIENLFLHRKGLKFEHRRDSSANLFSDILIVVFAAYISSLLSIWISIVLVGVELAVFIYFRQRVKNGNSI